MADKFGVEMILRVEAVVYADSFEEAHEKFLEGGVMVAGNKATVISKRFDISEAYYTPSKEK
jgi:hypothetical protein